MTALIERLRAATGPSVELDARIACWLGNWAVPEGPHVHWPMLAQAQGAKPYTASIDAALSLLPDGWSYILFSDQSEGVFPHGPFARVYKYGGPGYTERGQTTAIALLIAILTALEANDETSGTISDG